MYSTKRLNWRTGAIAAALLVTTTVQVGCNNTQAGAIIGAIAGAAIGSNSGAGGAIAGAAIGSLIGAAYGNLIDNEPYWYVDSYGVRRSYVVRQTYEVREVRYIPARPRGYEERDEYVYVERYHRETHVRRWYYNNHCDAQYYIVGVYDSAKAVNALDLLDPTNEENVARSARNWGLPEKTAQVLLSKEYLAFQSSDSSPVLAIFKSQFDKGSQKEFEGLFRQDGSLEVSNETAAKVARALSGLANEEISVSDAKAFILSSAKVAHGS